MTVRDLLLERRVTRPPGRKRGRGADGPPEHTRMATLRRLLPRDGNDRSTLLTRACVRARLVTDTHAHIFHVRDRSRSQSSETGNGGGVGGLLLDC